MKLFLKLLPYLMIVMMGFGIYFGFRYMSNKVAESEKQAQCLMIEKAELEARLEAEKNISNISIEQLEIMRKNEKNALKYIADCNAKINAIDFSENDDIILMKINNYEICMAKNSLNPEIICELDLK